MPVQILFTDELLEAVAAVKAHGLLVQQHVSLQRTLECEHFAAELAAEGIVSQVDLLVFSKVYKRLELIVAHLADERPGVGVREGVATQRALVCKFLLKCRFYKAEGSFSGVVTVILAKKTVFQDFSGPAVSTKKFMMIT